MSLIQGSVDIEGAGGGNRPISDKGSGMGFKDWQKKHDALVTMRNWVGVIVGAIFLIRTSLPWWQGLIGMIAINTVASLGAVYAAWLSASDGRGAQR